jgi:hypothetical protein
MNVSLLRYPTSLIYFSGGGSLLCQQNARTSDVRGTEDFLRAKGRWWILAGCKADCECCVITWNHWGLSSFNLNILFLGINWLA